MEPKNKVEVFKTNVSDQFTAQKIVNLIHTEFSYWIANFDLEDCDHILRVKSKVNEVCTQTIIDLIASNGHDAVVLPD